MTLHDPSARQDHETPRRSSLRDFFRRRPRPRPHPLTVAPSGPSARARRREQRRLAAIDRRIVSETPQLASMFAMFNVLNSSERTGGAEVLPPPERAHFRPIYLAVLVGLAAVAALCFALTTQVQAVARPCTVASASSGAIIAASAGAPACVTYAAHSTGNN